MLFGLFGNKCEDCEKKYVFMVRHYRKCIPRLERKAQEAKYVMERIEYQDEEIECLLNKIISKRKEYVSGDVWL